MDNNEIRKANRKAMPKFILIMVISLIIGGTIGFFSAKYSLNALSGSIQMIGEFFGIYIAPWLMLAITIIVPVVSVPLYKRTKKLLSTWDGEDEEISDTVDEKYFITKEIEVPIYKTLDHNLAHEYRPYYFLFSYRCIVFWRFCYF